MMGFSYFSENVTALSILVVTRDFYLPRQISQDQNFQRYSKDIAESLRLSSSNYDIDYAMLFRILHDCMLRAAGQLLQLRVTSVVYAMKYL